MNVAGKFDECRTLTLLLPNELVGIQQNADGAQVSWMRLLSGRLVTNIAASRLDDMNSVTQRGVNCGVLIDHCEAAPSWLQDRLNGHRQVMITPRRIREGGFES